jgi:aspartate/glutamate racemase
MARIQAHAEKLWWAGEAGNVELAKFYRHEIKEEMEVVADAGIVEDGIKVSENMQVYGIRSIEAMKELLATSGLQEFRTGYETLVLSCNSCHKASGHPEIRIGVPTENRFTGQIFAPEK